MHIEGKGIVVTGASSGIGAALARALAGRGARLVLAARSEMRLRAVAAPIEPAPLVVACDVTDPAAVRTLVRAARRHLGGIDALVNNAGRCVYGAAERTAPGDLQSLLAVNLCGPLYGMREVVPEMRRRGRGLVVNVASVAALHGVPYLAAYAASKAAIAALSQSWRAELAGTGVRFLTVYPGYTRTPLFTTEKKVGGARRPRRGYAPPEKVAWAILRAIERDRTELVLSLEGRALAALRGVVPSLVEKAMERIASALRLEEPAFGTGGLP